MGPGSSPDLIRGPRPVRGRPGMTFRWCLGLITKRSSRGRATARPGRFPRFAPNRRGAFRDWLQRVEVSLIGCLMNNGFVLVAKFVQVPERLAFVGRNARNGFNVLDNVWHDI